jgi:DNA-binding transcriptional regulator LsrR (DeoR family)
VRRANPLPPHSDRSAAVAAAIRGGLVKTLVIDEGGAGALVERAK